MWWVLVNAPPALYNTLRILALMRRRPIITIGNQQDRQQHFAGCLGKVARNSSTCDKCRAPTVWSD
jgi:hypothetical protein